MMVEPDQRVHFNSISDDPKAMWEALAKVYFRTYKAWAENHFRAKIQALQDDKGGEYISNAFIKFTQDCGIERWHTTCNRPQQNGVAERC